MRGQLSQVACRWGERWVYERRSRKNAIAPSATTASAATPMTSGPFPGLEPAVGAELTCTATALADGVGVSVGGGAVGDEALGDGVVGESVDVVVGAAVG